MIPAAEWAEIAEEYRRAYADERGRWDGMTELYGAGWWREPQHRPLVRAMCLVLGALMTAAVQAERFAAEAALRDLVRSAGGRLTEDAR